jgi:hypothetical protein
VKGLSTHHGRQNIITKSKIKLFAFFVYCSIFLLGTSGICHSLYIDRIALELSFEIFFANVLTISCGSPFCYHIDICYSLSLISSLHL